MDVGLRAPDWPEEVEGTYLRMDVPLIVPALLQWLEGQQAGGASTPTPPPPTPALHLQSGCSAHINLGLLTSAALQYPKLVAA